MPLSTVMTSQSSAYGRLPQIFFYSIQNIFIYSTQKTEIKTKFNISDKYNLLIEEN